MNRRGLFCLVAGTVAAATVEDKDQPHQARAVDGDGGTASVRVGVYAPDSGDMGRGSAPSPRRRA